MPSSWRSCATKVWLVMPCAASMAWSPSHRRCAVARIAGLDDRRCSRSSLTSRFCRFAAPAARARAPARRASRAASSVVEHLDVDVGHLLAQPLDLALVRLVHSARVMARPFDLGTVAAPPLASASSPDAEETQRRKDQPHQQELQSLVCVRTNSNMAFLEALNVLCHAQKANRRFAWVGQWRLHARRPALSRRVRAGEF